MPDLSRDQPPDFDGYQAVKLVRSGPVADLYEAVQRPLGRHVFIKALSSSILPSSPFAATLEREARLLAELDHPNILHLFDFVRTGERMWLVLEHVEGTTLDILLERAGRLPPPVATAIILEVARALEHAHDHGVVHRDLRPRNVAISQRGHVKLTDFAVAVDERLPTAPELLDGSSSFGGPAYMSPEQILGEPADPRSDLFSLGVVLYETLAGKRPFDAPDERNVTQRIRHDAPLPLGRVVTGIPSALERTVLHCLEKMPSDRFDSAADVVRALKQVVVALGVDSVHRVIAEQLVTLGLVTSQTIVASEAPPSLASPRDFPFGAAVGGLVVCALLAVGGGVFLQYGLAQPEQRAVRGHTPRLELTPASAGYLRVVAEPWAHVVVDGQHVDTTPFAQPIPLTPGVHYVRLEHPQAPTEHRTVQIGTGESILLDVRMAVEAPIVDAGVEEAVPSASASASGPDASP